MLMKVINYKKAVFLKIVSLKYYLNNLFIGLYLKMWKLEIFKRIFYDSTNEMLKISQAEFLTALTTSYLH